MKSGAVLLAAGAVAAAATITRRRRKKPEKKSVATQTPHLLSRGLSAEDSRKVLGLTTPCEETLGGSYIVSGTAHAVGEAIEYPHESYGEGGEYSHQTNGLENGAGEDEGREERGILTNSEPTLLEFTEIEKKEHRGVSNDYEYDKVQQDGLDKSRVVEDDQEERDLWADYEVEYSRPMGGVEENWVRAVTSGTGVCVVMIVIARQVAAWQVTYAAQELQRRHGMLRSWIVFDQDGKPRLEVARGPFLKAGVESVRLGPTGAVEINANAEGGWEDWPTEGLEPGGEVAIIDWQQILERELNTPFERTTLPTELFISGIDPSEARIATLAVKLHFLPGGRCSVALRVHTAACDYAAVALVAGEFVNLLDQVVAQTDEQLLFEGPIPGVPTTLPKGMKRVFSNAGLHREDEWLIGEQFEGSPRLRRAVSHHKLHRERSEENLQPVGMRRVQSAVHLDRGFGSFVATGGSTTAAFQGAEVVIGSEADGGGQFDRQNGGMKDLTEARKNAQESPNSCLQGPMSASTSASSLIPESDGQTFSRVPTEDGKPLYDVSEFPLLDPRQNDPPGQDLPTLKPLKINGNPDLHSPPLSPTFSSPGSFASARSLPLSPWSSPKHTRDSPFVFGPPGGEDSHSPAPPPSPLSSCESPGRHAVVGLIDPFAELHGNTPHKTDHQRSSQCTISAPSVPQGNRKPAHVSIGPLEYLKEGSDARPCVEDLVDKHRAKKPFWAKGKDLVGYSVGSLGKPLLAFQPGWTAPFRTQVVSASISQAATQALLAACEARNTSLYGALSASCFKAVAASKKTGPCPETYGITTMVNCRTDLREPLREADVGFFHSALMHHHSVAETTELWELARRCSETLERALADDKQLKDMGVLNMLFYQAMQHPNLTPQSSLRTSVLCAFSSSVHVPLPTTSTLELTDFIGCASVHGVGPCIGIFSFMINGNLHYCLAFPVPLFSREQVGGVNERMREMLESCADSVDAI